MLSTILLHHLFYQSFPLLLLPQFPHHQTLEVCIVDTAGSGHTIALLCLLLCLLFPQPLYSQLVLLEPGLDVDRHLGGGQGVELHEGAASLLLVADHGGHLAVLAEDPLQLVRGVLTR